MQCASPARASLAMLTGLENKILGIWYPSLTYTNEEATLICERRAGFKPDPAVEIARPRRGVPQA